MGRRCVTPLRETSSPLTGLILSQQTSSHCFQSQPNPMQSWKISSLQPLSEMTSINGNQNRSLGFRQEQDQWWTHHQIWIRVFENAEQRCEPGARLRSLVFQLF